MGSPGLSKLSVEKHPLESFDDVALADDVASMAVCVREILAVLEGARPPQDEPAPLPEGARWDDNPGKSLRLWWWDERGNECYTCAAYGSLCSKRMEAGSLRAIDTPLPMARAVLAKAKEVGHG